MLATGVRTMVGVKVLGRDLGEVQATSEQVAKAVRTVPGAVDVFPDRSLGKGYVEVEIDRVRAARYGINAADVMDVVEVAVGGRPITQMIQGRERYPVRLRYARSARLDEESIRHILVAAPAAMTAGEPPRPRPRLGTAGDPAAAAAMPGMSGDVAPARWNDAAGQAPPLQIPLGEIANVRVVEGPAIIKSENGLLRNYVQLNVRGRDVVGFVNEARRVVAEQVKLPEGVHLEWSGQFEHQVRARRTLSVVFPVVVTLIFLLLYVTYRDLAHAGLVMMAVPGALAGGVIFQRIFGFNFSVAVWVGYIACFGMATETGIVMLVYLRQAIRKAGGLESIVSEAQLRSLVLDGAVRRLRPKLLTEATCILGLAPMLWATGVGAEVMRPMAAPVLGGILIADEVIDLFVPVLFFAIEKRRWLRLPARST
jgi:Cu(I)/Ag(I) efflux system membrane protein CusA/SilA